jgi:hypothetical protein
VKVKGWKNIFHASGNQKRTGEAICISGKGLYIKNYKKRQRRLYANQLSIAGTKPLGQLRMKKDLFWLMVSEVKSPWPLDSVVLWKQNMAGNTWWENLLTSG